MLLMDTADGGGDGEAGGDREEEEKSRCRWTSPRNTLPMALMTMTSKMIECVADPTYALNWVCDRRQ